MTDRSSGHPRRWAPEWIAVATLAVAIVALGGGLFASLNAMEVRIRDDMRSMENRIREDMATMRGDMRSMEHRIREDMRELRTDVGTLRERVTRLDERVSRLDDRVSRLDDRVLRLESRFDEEFPPRSASVPSSMTGRTGSAQNVRL